MQRIAAAINSALQRAEGLSAETIAALANDRHLKESDEPCGRCGQANVICCHAELGGAADYRDYFAHVCLNPACGHAQHYESVVSLGQETPEDQLCCFCGRDVRGFRAETEPIQNAAVKESEV